MAPELVFSLSALMLTALVGASLVMALRRDGLALRSRPVIGACAAGLVAAALGVFLLGRPGLPDAPMAEREARLLAADPAQLSQQELLARVRAEVKRNPNDARLWGFLGQLLMRDGRSNEAAQAYGRAVETGGATPQRLTNWGTALLAANDGLADKAATNAFREALRLDPDHARASFFLAESLRQAGEVDAARRRFEALAARGASAEPWSRAAQEALASSAFTTGPS